MGKGRSLYDHPRYHLLDPLPEDTAVSYALRCAANLVSPPKVGGESDEIECNQVAADILLLKKQVEERWAKHVFSLR